MVTPPMVVLLPSAALAFVAEGPAAGCSSTGTSSIFSLFSSSAMFVMLDVEM